MKTNMEQRSKYTLMQWYNKIEKQKLNTVVEKENTRWTIKSEN
jgi:hypothetical protein